MTEKTIGPDISWRLIYQGDTVLGLFETSGYTTTIQEVFEATTKQECLDEIALLGLNYTQEEEVTE